MGTCIGQPSIWDWNPNIEEKHEPGFGIKKSFNHLILLESLILYSGLISPDSIDRDSFLTFRDKFGFNWIVGQENCNEYRPDASHGSCDPEEVTPLFITRDKANGVSDWASEEHRKPSEHQASSDRLFSIELLAYYFTGDELIYTFGCTTSQWLGSYRAQSVPPKLRARLWEQWVSQSYLQSQFQWGQSPIAFGRTP